MLNKFAVNLLKYRILNCQGGGMVALLNKRMNEAK